MALMSQFRLFPFTSFFKEISVPSSLDRNQDLSPYFSLSRVFCLLLSFVALHNISHAVRCMGRSGRAPAGLRRIKENNSLTMEHFFPHTHTHTQLFQIFQLFLPSLISFLTSENDS